MTSTSAWTPKMSLKGFGYPAAQDSACPMHFLSVESQLCLSQGHLCLNHRQRLSVAYILRARCATITR